MCNPTSALSISPNRLLPAMTVALAAAGLLSTAHAQLQTAGDLLVNVDATTGIAGALTSIANGGTLGGVFEARGSGGATMPAIANVHGNGTPGIQFVQFGSVTNYMQLVDSVGGTIVSPPPGIVGVNPDFTIEAWIMNPSLQQEESVVAWARRGGPEGSNCTFNYGWDASYGAMGHWGAAADMGWDSASSTVGAYPPRVPVPGKWHHLVYTVDGATQRVYANGVEQNSEAVTLNLHGGTSIIIAAQLNTDGITPVIFGSFTLGRLRIHDGVLSAGQVSSNYELEKGDFSNGGAPLTAGPIHRYSFNNPAGPAPSGSIVTDSVGGANGVVLGADATFTGSRVTVPGGSSGLAAYVDLPNNLLSANGAANGGSGEVTFEAWIKITAEQNWGRIFDFGSTDIGGGVGGELSGPGGGGAGLDYFMWSSSIGTDGRNQRVELKNEDPAGGGIVTVDHPTAMNVIPRKDAHIAVTWKESENQILIYENGSLVSTLTTDDKMSDIHDVNNWLGRSNWTGDQNMQGEFDEFRIYNYALPPEQIQTSYVGGPDNIATPDPVFIVTQPTDLTVGEAESATFSILANGSVPISHQWYRDDTLVPDATSASYTISPAQAADDGTTVFCIASNNLLGTAYTVTSAVVSLTVLVDTNPPTIDVARVAAANQVEVHFSEPVNAADAGVSFNYGVSGPEGVVAVAAADVQTPTRVLLTLGASLGCAYYTVTASGIRDVSVRENVTAPGTSAGFWNFAPPILTHRYPFNNVPATDATGAAVPDIIGAANGQVLNASGTISFTGDKVAMSGGPSATSPYVDLPNNLLSNNSTNRGGTGQLTLEGWIKITGAQNWSRVFDFGACGGAELTAPGGSGNGTDVIIYAAMRGTTVTARRVEKNGAGATGTAGDFNASNFGQDFHWVVTWDEATGEIKAYEDGVRVVSIATSAAMDTVNDVNMWLGRSNWTGDNNTQGEYDEFRIYNYVLSTNDILRNKAGGPDSDFGEPLSLDVLANDMITNSTRQVRVNVEFAKVGVHDIARSGCVAYQSDNPSVIEVSPDGVLTSHDTGSATITAQFNGLSDSVLVNVIVDNDPPLLVRARGIGNRYIEVTYSEPVDNLTGADSFNYEVTGTVFVTTASAAEQLPDPTRILLTLTDPMPCEYITVTANSVTDIVGNEIAPDSQIGFMNLTPQSLIHRYTFNEWAGNAPSGVVVHDGVGGLDGTVLGAGATFTSDRIALPGGPSASAAYVDLPNGILSDNSTNRGGSGQITLEGWFKPTGIRFWSRVFDFGASDGAEITGPGGAGSGTEVFLYAAMMDTQPTRRRVEKNGVGAVLRDFDVANFNQDFHWVVTWDEATGTIEVFEDGVRRVSMPTSAALSDVNDVNAWIGRSNWTGDENTQGEYDEFRVYNRVLSLPEIVQNGLLGPDSDVGQPLAVYFGGSRVIPLGQTVQPIILADFTSVSNVDLSMSGCATLESSDPNVIAVTPDGLLEGRAEGSATITVRFSGLSSSDSFLVSTGTGPGLNEVAIALEPGPTVRVSYLGIPGTSYQLVRAATVTGPYDTVVDTQVAPAGGLIEFVDPNPPSPSAFYQVLRP